MAAARPWHWARPTGEGGADGRGVGDAGPQVVTTTA